MKKVSLILLVIMCMFLVGCSLENNNEPSEDEETIVEMTQEEEDILCSVYVNEERIKEGKLYDYQLEALNQFRSANNYLKEKYPGYDFNYFAYHPANKTQDLTLLEFTVDDTENYFIVEIKIEDDKYIITDNLYTYILRPIFDEMLTEKFEQAGLENFYVYTRMAGKFGKELDLYATVDDILAVGTEMKRDVDVYIDMSPYDESRKQEIVNIVEQELRKINNYGACIIYFEEGITSKCSSGEECLEYRKEHRMESITFNTFDLKN